MLRRWIAVVGFAALGLTQAAQAQEALRSFCADRPGKGSPPCILDTGHMEAELGLIDAAFQRAGPGSSETYEFAQLDLRFGLAATTELQLSWTAYTQLREHFAGETTIRDGAGDLTLALRQSLRNPDGSGLSIAIQPYITAPTGRTGIGAGAWQGGVILPVSAELGGGWSLGLSPELDLLADAEGNGTHVAWSSAAGLSRPLGDLTLGTEFWVGVDDNPGDHTTQASFDLTAAWMPSAAPNLQLDLGVYFGLSPDTPDLEMAMGIARRF